MISMAPSSLTAGGSAEQATRSSAATMGEKSSYIAWMLDPGAWMLDAGGSGADDVVGLMPVALRFTP
jgi:hypothetical protein